MRHTGFRYTVQPTVTFSGHELWTLFDNGHMHYDTKCKAAVRPPTEPGHGGEVWVLLNHFCDASRDGTDEGAARGEWLEGETSEELFRRTCAAFPDATITEDLSTDVLQRLGKIAELTCGGNGETSRHLSTTIRQVLDAANIEHRRVNPPTKQEGFIIVAPVASCCYACAKIIPEGTSGRFVQLKGLRHLDCPA